ncbi:MAG: class I SAM-dependent methyltransferase [Gemmatimonadota bacterium]
MTRRPVRGSATEAVDRAPGATTMPDRRATAGRRAADPARYYAAYPLTHHAYAVARIAGTAIRNRALRYFSGRMLDIGCGSKAKTWLVGDCVDHHIGLDHADSPHGTHAIDICGTAYAIPLADRAVDCVLSTAVLEHLEDPAAALCETRRVLRPGGVAMFTAPLFWPVHEAPRDFFRFTGFGLHELFRGAGLEPLEVTALSGFWTMAGAQLGAYLRPYRRGALRFPIAALVAAFNLILPKLDCGRLRDERFAWMHIVVARRPTGKAGRRPEEPNA